MRKATQNPCRMHTGLTRVGAMLHAPWLPDQCMEKDGATRIATSPHLPEPRAGSLARSPTGRRQPSGRALRPGRWAGRTGGAAPVAGGKHRKLSGVRQEDCLKRKGRVYGRLDRLAWRTRSRSKPNTTSMATTRAGGAACLTRCMQARVRGCARTSMAPARVEGQGELARAGSSYSHTPTSTPPGSCRAQVSGAAFHSLRCAGKGP